MSQRIVVTHHAVERYRQRIDPAAGFEDARGRVYAAALRAKPLKRRAVGGEYWDAGECVLIVRSDRLRSNARIVVTLVTRGDVYGHDDCDQLRDDDVDYTVPLPEPPRPSPAQPVRMPEPPRKRSQPARSGEQLQREAIRLARERDAERAKRHAFALLLDKLFKTPARLTRAMEYMAMQAESGDERATAILSELSEMDRCREQCRLLPLEVVEEETWRLLQLARKHGLPIDDFEESPL